MGRDNAAARQMTLVAFLQAARTAPTIRRPGAILPPRRTSSRAALLPADCPNSRRGQVPPGVLRRSACHAGPLWGRFHRCGTARHSRGQDGPDPCPHGYGTGHSAPRLGGTYSTTYYEPFHVARVFATLDLISGGRVAWNVVTSLNDSEAANLGRRTTPSTTCATTAPTSSWRWSFGHWDSWEDDALVSTEARAVRRSREGASPGPRGAVFQLPWSVHRATLTAGPPGHHAGGAQRPGPPVCGALGRADLRHLPSPDFGRDVRRASGGRGTLWQRSAAPPSPPSDLR